ncbi:MAG: tetratricopeptide repeat protein [Spirochaetales bacterium]|nr:tetratricopeptide repeat protein [Spirochaetales bacterium]
MHRRLPAVFIMSCFLIASCSTAPEQPKEKTEKKNQAAEYTEAGNAYFNEGRYTQALRFFNLALNDNVSVDNEAGIVESYNSIGKVYLAAGYLEEAEEHFRKALAQAQLLQDPLLIARSSTNLAEVYLEREETEVAAALLEESRGALAGNQEEDRRAELAIIYHDIGSVFKIRGMLDEAHEYFKQALAINTELERYEEIASNYYMIASIHSKREEFLAARENIDLALSFDKRVENSVGIAKDLFARGMIEEKAGNDEQAFISYEKSFQVYQAMYLYRNAAQVLPRLISLAERLGREQDALRYRELEKKFHGS